jgi:hypothetical protein
MTMKLLPAILCLGIVVPPVTGQRKGKSDSPVPRPLYALTLAADPGKTSKLTLRGLNLDTATEVRVGEPKSSGKVLGPGRKTPVANPLNPQAVGDTEIDVEITLPVEVPGGTVPISLMGPGGEGPAMLLLVNDDTPRVPEKEPNDGFRQAMPVSVPQIVEASFKQSQDADVYRIDVRAGETYLIEVQARRYGSPAEPLLTIYDADGRTVADGEPIPGSTDPRARLTAPRDGHYFLAVLEGFDQGGPQFVYRLSVRRVP